MDIKPTISIDFDGTIHSYQNGWQDGQIYGTVLPGFFEWCRKAIDQFTLVVYSTRSNSSSRLLQMEDWLKKQLVRWWDEQNESGPNPITLKFAVTKPLAMMSIDDAAIQFMGNWGDPVLQPETLAKFKPWHQDGKTINATIRITSDAVLTETISQAIYDYVRNDLNQWNNWPGADYLAAEIVKKLKEKQMIQ